MQGGSVRGANTWLVSEQGTQLLQEGSSACSHCGGSTLHDANQPGQAIEDSFVVVPPATSFVYPSSLLQPNHAGFNSAVSVLTRVFDTATTRTQVEQPLCVECMRVLLVELDKEVEDVNRDIKAYEACLHTLEGEVQDALTEADFCKEKFKIEAEERKLEVAIEETEKQCAQVNNEIKKLELKSSRFEELEDRYWHKFNSYQFQLNSQQEESDSIFAKIEVSQAHLELLKQAAVLNEAFKIGHDGEFGTINNFRLGRLPNIQVDWDEINAAWGQACLLLHTMAQYFTPKFQYPIKMLPMGSYPRITDSNNNTYELFYHGNLFASTRYDKAMALFLTCLKDFADFANLKDQEKHIPCDKCFQLPFKIEHDKVKNHSIAWSLKKQRTWTKALKYLLCDLNWTLSWFVANTSFQPLSATSASPAQVPAAGSLYLTKKMK